MSTWNESTYLVRAPIDSFRTETLASWVSTTAPRSLGLLNLPSWSLLFQHTALPLIQKANPTCQTIPLDLYGVAISSTKVLLITINESRDLQGLRIPRPRKSPPSVKRQTSKHWKERGLAFVYNLCDNLFVSECLVLGSAATVILTLEQPCNPHGESECSHICPLSPSRVTGWLGAHCYLPGLLLLTLRKGILDCHLLPALTVSTEQHGHLLCLKATTAH